MKRSAGWLLGMLAAGCGGCGGHEPEVRWPASAPVSLADELAATSPDATPMLPDGTRVELGTDLPEDAPDIQARAYVFEGLWYAEVRLGRADEDIALPLVVMLHGRGDRPRIPGGPFGRVPTPMRVLIPRGPLALGTGYAWARHSVTEHRDDDLAADLVAMADRLARLIRHVRESRPTAGSTILTGFSQGAITAWTTALRHPEAVGLVLPIAGWVPPGALPAPLSPEGAAPVLSMHGTADPIVRVEPTRALVELLTEAGLSVTFLEVEGVEHLVTPSMNAQFEEWLEAALHERAPDLRGGLGEAGPDPEPVEPYEPRRRRERVNDAEEAVPAPLPPDGSPVSRRRAPRTRR